MAAYLYNIFLYIYYIFLYMLRWYYRIFLNFVVM